MKSVRSTSRTWILGIGKPILRASSIKGSEVVVDIFRRAFIFTNGITEQRSRSFRFKGQLT